MHAKSKCVIELHQGCRRLISRRPRRDMYAMGPAARQLAQKSSDDSYEFDRIMAQTFSPLADEIGGLKVFVRFVIGSFLFGQLIKVLTHNF